MKIGEQIPWNVKTICETFKISCLMGKPPMRDVLGNHLKDQLYILVHWLSITQNCEGPVKNPSIRKESLTWIVPRICIVRGGNLEWVTYWLQTLRSWKRWTHQEWKIYFSSRRWTNQTSRRRSGTENTHLDTGTPNSRRRSRRFSWRIRRVSSTTSWLTSGCRWSNSWFLVHFRKHYTTPSRRTQSQTLLTERRIIPFSTEIHWRIQNYLYKFGCQTREMHRWLLECRWVKRLVGSLDRFHSVYSIERETSRRKNVVRGRD